MDATSPPDLASSAPGSPHSAEQEDAAPALSASDVTKRWRTWKEPILKGVDLEVQPGGTVWIAGRNGTGKTTFLRILGGMIAADGGSVSLNGLSPERDARSYRSRVGMVSAGNTGLFARLSVRRHLEYWARLAFVPRSRRPVAIERVVDAFALHEIASRRVDRLSMGQRQRVRIAMAFLHEPELVLLDEPQTSLDDEGVAMLQGAIGDMLALGHVCVWCSPVGEHPMLGYSQRFEMREGRLERP